MKCMSIHPNTLCKLKFSSHGEQLQTPTSLFLREKQNLIVLPTPVRHGMSEGGVGRASTWALTYNFTTLLIAMLMHVWIIMFIT